MSTEPVASQSRYAMAIGALSLISFMVAAIGTQILWNFINGSISWTIVQALCANAFFWGGGVFLLHGSSRVTFTGVFAAAIAVLVGVSGFLSVGANTVDGFAPAWLGIAVGCATLISIAAVAVAWFLGALVPGSRPKGGVSAPAISVAESSAAKVIGALLVAGATVIQTVLFGLQVSGYIEAAAFVGIILYCGGLVFGPTSKKFILHVAVLALFFLIYIEVIHTGGGRMRVVSLCIAVLLLVSMRWDLRWLKPAILAAMPLFLYFVGRLRLEYREEIGASSRSDSDGLESVYQPIRGFAQVLHDLAATGAVGIDSMGQWSFVAAIFPGGRDSAYWNPFGYQFGQLWTGGEASASYSAYALWYGELASFWGILGLLGSVVLCGGLIYLGERGLRFAATSGSRLGLITFIVVLLASVGSLLWGGFYLAYARALILLVFVLAVWIILQTVGMKNSEIAQ